ncbi:extracellular solute-binding protein [Eubacteriales bacterium OttesenSCG-928-G02]|nr:extracellular solute-binding protein [Eubacteriales bacterium OttesenSCG-928-G02]
MKKLIVFFILAGIISSILLSCTGDDNTSSTNAQSEVSDTSTASSPEESDTSEDEEDEYEVLDVDFKGTEITILGKRDGAHTFSRKQWEYDPEIEADAINEAVKNRNDWIYDTYGIEIKYMSEPNGEYFITKTVEAEIETQLGTFDVICDGLTTLAALSLNGYLYDLSTINKNLDLSKPWWDNRVTEAISINNKVFYAAGDILITDDEYTYCLLYNKDLMATNNVYNTIGFESLYDAVNKGKWTYDMMFSIGKLCSARISGGDSKTKDDIFGLTADIGCLYYMMTGAGVTLASKNSDDMPALSVYNEENENLLSTLMNYMNDRENVIWTERFYENSTMYGDAEAQFGEGRSAFYMSKLGALTTLLQDAESTTKTGILPIPKKDDDQVDYFNTIAPLHFSAVAIPLSNFDKLEATCIALEALGYLGKKNLTDAYIERTLKIQHSDDTPDSIMVDFILRNRAIDFAVVYDIAGLNSFFNKYASYSAELTFNSDWQAIEGKAKDDIQKIIDVFYN